MLTNDLQQRIARAEEFATHIQPQPGVDYAWVEEYAFKAYEETARKTEALDAKAEKLAGFATAAAGTVAALMGHLAVTQAHAWPVALAALPAIGFFVAAVSLALTVPRPTTQFELPDVEAAFDYAAYFQEDGADVARAAFAAKIHWTREQQRGVILEKADGLKAANRMLLLALRCLLLPVAAAIAVGLLFR